jgi:hypothetical protein
MDHFGMILPHSGSRSHRLISGTRVGRTPNSPRYSAGASGLGSHRSIWLGPPRIQRLITELTVEREPARASARSNSAKVNPVVPRIPAFRKLRRSRCKLRRKSIQPARAARLVIGHSRTDNLRMRACWPLKKPPGKQPAPGPGRGCSTPGIVAQLPERNNKDQCGCDSARPAVRGQWQTGALLHSVRARWLFLWPVRWLAGNACS